MITVLTMIAKVTVIPFLGVLALHSGSKLPKGTRGNLNDSADEDVLDFDCDIKLKLDLLLGATPRAVSVRLVSKPFVIGLQLEGHCSVSRLFSCLPFSFPCLGAGGRAFKSPRPDQIPFIFSDPFTKAVTCLKCR